TQTRSASCRCNYESVLSCRASHCPSPALKVKHQKEFCSPVENSFLREIQQGSIPRFWIFNKVPHQLLQQFLPESGAQKQAHCLWKPSQTSLPACRPSPPASPRAPLTCFQPQLVPFASTCTSPAPTMGPFSSRRKPGLCTLPICFSN
uniref:Uncharacterized protein n=1 Tax=Taeniopygia guttata TaxID=59729 RepID=A0A674HIS0_TAEGU